MMPREAKQKLLQKLHRDMEKRSKLEITLAQGCDAETAKLLDKRLRNTKQRLSQHLETLWLETL